MFVSEADFEYEVGDCVSDDAGSVENVPQVTAGSGDEDFDDSEAGDDSDVDAMVEGLREQDEHAFSNSLASDFESGLFNDVMAMTESIWDDLEIDTLAQPRRPADWKGGVGSAQWRIASGPDIALTASHLSHAINKALGDLTTRFEHGFAAAHLLFLIAESTPTPGWRVDSVKPDKQLRKVLESAFRCASVKTKSDGLVADAVAQVFAVLSPQQLDSESTAEAFRSLRATSQGQRLYALKLAGEHVIKALTSQAEKCGEGTRLDALLTQVRQTVVRGRSERHMRKSVTKAQHGK